MAAAAGDDLSQGWKRDRDQAVQNPTDWNIYDCNLQSTVGAYNRHLQDTTGYRQLNWKLIKAMIWVETGARTPEWKTKPMQIGNPGDPGLAALLNGREGGELIIPPLWRGKLTGASVGTIPQNNIAAGIGYLLMRHASFDHKSIISDQKTYVETVKKNDSLSKIANRVGSTTELLKQLNPTVGILQVNQKISYKKASMQKVITGWTGITTATIANRYNGGGDEKYQAKLDYVMALLQKIEDGQCAE